MFQAIGHPVSKLRRVAIGPISDPKLTPGVWRELTRQEVKLLETFKDMRPQGRAPRPRKVVAGPRKATSKKAKSVPSSKSGGRAKQVRKGRTTATRRG